MALRKQDFADRICDELTCSKKDSIEIVEILIEIMKATLSSGNDILISGFGKFSVKTKKERLGRNPATGESMVLRPRKVVTFKAAGKLKEKLNGRK